MFVSDRRSMCNIEKYVKEKFVILFDILIKRTGISFSFYTCNFYVNFYVRLFM